MDAAAEMQTLAEEIFSLTGQKVEASDPVVVAALFQSHLLRNVHAEALLEFQESIRASLDHVNAALTTEQQKVEAVTQATKIAQSQMMQLARSAMSYEIPKMRAEFHQVATEVLMEANGLVIKDHTRKLLAGAGIAMVLALAIGFHLGSKFSKPVPAATAIHDQSNGSIPDAKQAGHLKLKASTEDRK